ncbi:LytR/AlgR family response regulator transcription factor [Pedobacter miscanthi]|uniref:DNA-binding response regulator n=1 Tax=Pedobacter miscanthi TaxID=2259170 RepID=A0A366KMI5_9SPHI|nr:LytTR family DNA-binding domain-containing protein [Pedobacter miscanthi]RBQ02865.1 DNA-binding response regulator [Pedobacter miscanthi]
MNCLIVDDQKIFRTVIKRLIGLDNTLTLVGECEDAIDAHQKIKDLNVDLIFLDIRMPGVNGIELAKILEGKQPLIIFTTSLAEHALEAFELNVVDFLLKPVSPARFLKAVDKAKEIFKKNQITMGGQFSEFTFIRDSNIVRRLKINDILYFEATGDYVKIRLLNEDYCIHSSLKIIEQKLPGHLFLRVHRSFIVNLAKIDSAEGKTLVVSRHLIPVSDAYRANLNKYMQFL